MRRNSDSNSGSNSSPTANDLTKRTIYEIQRVVPGSRMWRSNVGAGVPMATVRKAIEALVSGQVQLALELLQQSRVIEFGRCLRLSDGRLSRILHVISGGDNACGSMAGRFAEFGMAVFCGAHRNCSRNRHQLFLSNS